MVSPAQGHICLIKNFRMLTFVTFLTLAWFAFLKFRVCNSRMSSFSSAKANTEFELKFTTPAALLLGVAEPITNKTAVYVQLGANLAAARRAIENLSGNEARARRNQRGGHVDRSSLRHDQAVGPAQPQGGRSCA